VSESKVWAYPLTLVLVGGTRKEVAIQEEDLQTEEE
jgi:hypothetical protein